MKDVPDGKSRLVESIPDDHFGDLLGIRHEIVQEGHVISRTTLGHEHRNPFGVGHGALVYAIADTGMGRALASVLPGGARCATLSATIQYLGPADGDALVAESSLVHLGEKVATTRCDVSTGDGTCCAVATATFYVSTQRREP